MTDPQTRVKQNLDKLIKDSSLQSQVKLNIMAIRNRLESKKADPTTLQGVRNDLLQIYESKLLNLTSEQRNNIYSSVRSLDDFIREIG